MDLVFICLLSIFASISFASPQLPLYTTDDFLLIGRGSCSIYYKSYGNARWNDASDSCRLLGDTATLVNIETKQELDKLHEMLDDDFDGSTSFWVDGKWDSKCYKWVAADQCVDETHVVHWFDNNRTSGNDRMRLQLIYHGASEDIKFRGTKIDNIARYICELPIDLPRCNTAI